MRKLKIIAFGLLAILMSFSMLFFSFSEEMEQDKNLIETGIVKDFIELAEDSVDIAEYEKTELDRILKEFEEEDKRTESIVSNSEESETNNETSSISSFESAVAEELLDNLNDNALDNETDVIVTESIVKNISTTSEINAENNFLEGVNLFGSGSHESTASPSVVINSTYDRYDIYTGENEGTVRIFDNNREYYNSNMTVKVIRDMMDRHSNSPILLKLANNVQFFNFDNSNDNYVLIPDGFVEDLVARESGNGYLNPRGINALDHIKVDLKFNGTELGKYDLFEYGVLYYLSCYEGVLGEYYYYDPNTTDIDRAATFYVNNRIMDRTYNIVSEYYYKSPSGEQLSFKPSWVVNSDSLTGADKEIYAKQWVSFPYFLIKTGEKYWNLRESIEQSTYLTEYAEGYYEQYLTEAPYGNVRERLTVLDEVYKTEADLINNNTNTVAAHPYVKSSLIEITGNFRPDTINGANKLRAGGVIPYDTYLVINLNVAERRAKSVQVYLNGEKLVSNNNRGLYSLTNGKCQIRIDASKLLEEENSRNVLSFILLDAMGNYLVDAQNRIINNYISIIRHSSISKRNHTIIFDTNGSSSLPVIQVEEGNKISLPRDPGKNGFTFNGWYEDNRLTKKFNVDEYIISDKRLYASWTQVVRYSSGGSSRGGGSGSGGGGGGGGGVAGGAVAASNMLTNSLQASSLPGALNQAFVGPTNAVSGTWTKVGNRKIFKDSAGNTYNDKWANIYDGISTDWYRFDAQGNAIVGFYEENHKVFYFDIGDKNINNMGKMAVGWRLIKSSDGKSYWYYFNEDGIGETKGAILTNGKTKEGFTVDANGRWTIDGVPQAVTLK